MPMRIVLFPVGVGYTEIGKQRTFTYTDDYWLHVSSEKKWVGARFAFAHQRLTTRTIDHLVQP